MWDVPSPRSPSCGRSRRAAAAQALSRVRVLSSLLLLRCRVGSSVGGSGTAERPPPPASPKLAVGHAALDCRACPPPGLGALGILEWISQGVHGLVAPRRELESRARAERTDDHHLVRGRIPDERNVVTVAHSTCELPTIVKSHDRSTTPANRKGNVCSVRSYATADRGTG